MRALEDADVVKVKDIIENEDNKTLLSDESMEIVASVCSYLTKETQEALPHLTTCCQDTLVTLANLGNPKEMLMALLEQLDTFQDSCCVIKLLPSLTVTLTRVKLANMSVSWVWALNTVTCHLNTCPTPSNTGLEAWERITLDQTPEAEECLNLCEATSSMVTSLVQVTEVNVTDPDNVYRKTVLINFILNILGPLSTLSQNIEIDDKGTKLHPGSREVCQQLMESMSKITSNNLINVCQFIESSERKKIGERDPIDIVCIPTYLYLLLCEEMSLETMPSIYTPIHLLRLSSSGIVVLLKDKNEIRIHKGLLLMNKLIAKIQTESISSESASDPKLVSMLDPLVTVIIYQEVEELRKLGFTCYSKYVEMFELSARYAIYTHLLNTVNHSGLLGWTITSLKDTFAKCLPKETFPEVFSGPSLSKLVLPLLKLKNGPETDLLEINDELLATLNLVQFVSLRDKENKTGFLDMKPQIQTWLDELTKGLDLSLAHYKQKLMEPDDKMIGETSFGVTVGGRQLPPMDPEKMKMVLTSAIKTFELIQFRLGYVKDIF